MLDMLAFFAGRTHADNVLKVVLKKPVRLIVDSVGGREIAATSSLIDTVHEGDKPVRQRKWIMRQSGPGHFIGSLTDATGPVDIAMSRDTATITYMMKGGLKVEQELTASARRQDAQQPCRGQKAGPQIRPRRRRRPQAGLTRRPC